MMFSRSSLALAILASVSLQAVVVFKGNNTADTTKTFGATINSCVFHAPTQTLYVGLDQTSSTYSLSKLSLAQNDCIGIASATGNNPLANTYISNLALSVPTSTPDSPRIICTSAENNTTAPTAIFAINSTGSKVTTAADINDASGAATAEAIVNVAASDSYIFAAVITNGSANNTNFGGGASDGIALLSIDPDSQALTPLSAATGLAGTTALALTAGTAVVDAGGANATMAANYTPALCWNQTLKRLYIGLQGTAAAKMMSVVIAKVDYDTNILSYLTPLANNYGALTDGTSIIGTSGANSVTAKQLAVMETSTGFFYLIIQGGNGTAANTNNVVYAVPLVSGDVDDSILGTFAAASLTTDDYTTQATNNGDLLVKTSPSALVGNGGFTGGAAKVTNAPIENGADRGISSLFVHGDSVFISIQSTNGPAASNAPGIYYSQAIFNNKGKIQGWTDWAKAAPFELGVSTLDGSSQDVFVNALTGHIISINQGLQTVKTTEWRTSDPDNDDALINILNDTFTDGCFSCCDLNQSTKILSAATAKRYALFGGRGKVAFALVSVADTIANESAAATAAQTLTTDFSSAANFLVTTLPNDTAPVTCLAYSKWNATNTSGFFFAGTKNGLYAYADPGNEEGFNVVNLANLNAAPFDTFTWQKVTNITGEVRAIKVLGTNSSVYVLTKSVVNGVPVDKVFQIPSNANITDINAGINTIATSDSGNLDNAYLFFDIALIPSAADLGTSYALLATSKGLYKSTTNIDGRNTQVDAGWTQVTTTVTDKIFTPYNTAYPFTCYPTAWTSSSTVPLSYNKSLLQQFSSISNGVTLTELPDNYITDVDSPSVINSISAMFNDGTRRFMIMQPDTTTNGTNALFALPYSCNEFAWNYTNGPRKLEDAVLNPSPTRRHYWVQMIGATGNVYVGTDKGVIALG